MIPEPSSLSITWELSSEMKILTPEIWGWNLAMCVLPGPPGDSVMQAPTYLKTAPWTSNLFNSQTTLR